MPSDFADELFQYLLNRFPADRDYRRGALHADGMPPLVAGLLGRTLDRWLEHELDSLESRWFDFDDPAVRAARAELIVALGRTARIPRSAWSETLRYAVGLVVRHLVTPARALTDATFEGSFDPLPQDVVRARIHVFEAYSYLPEIADAYLAQKQPDAITPDSLFELLQRIDKRVTQDYTVEDWLRVLAPLFALVRTLPDQRGIPAEMAVRFFRAKGQKAIADTLAARVKAVDESTLAEIIRDTIGDKQIGEEVPPPVVIPETREESIHIPDIEDFEPEIEFEEDFPEPVMETEAHKDLFDAMSEIEDVEDDPIAEIDESTVQQEIEPEIDIVEALTDDSEEEIEEDTEALPLWKRYAVDPPASVVAESASTVNDNGGTVGTPLWQRFLSGLRGSSSAEEPSEDPIPENIPEPSNTPLLDDLEREILGENAHKNRKKYVRELFRGDESAYATVLQRLSHSRTWSQASQIIAQDIFRKYEVDIYSDVAVSFTDTANRRFE